MAGSRQTPVTGCLAGPVLRARLGSHTGSCWSAGWRPHPPPVSSARRGAQRRGPRPEQELGPPTQCWAVLSHQPSAVWSDLPQPHRPLWTELGTAALGGPPHTRGALASWQAQTTGPRQPGPPQQNSSHPVRPPGGAQMMLQVTPPGARRASGQCRRRCPPWGGPESPQET